MLSWEKLGQAEIVPDVADEFFEIHQPVLKKIVNLFWINILIFMDKTITEARHVCNRFCKKGRNHLRLAELDQNVPVIGHVPDSLVSQGVASKIQNALNCNKKGMLRSELGISVRQEIFKRFLLMTAKRFKHLADRFKFCADDLNLNHERKAPPDFSNIGSNKIAECV